MPDGPVVADTTPLVALWILGRLDVLATLFGEVTIPSGVHAEFVATASDERRAALGSATWIRVETVDDAARIPTDAGLDQGEAEVIALAEERGARLVIVDEMRARRAAERRGLPLTGTVGVLLLAKEHGLVASVLTEVSRLREAGLYLGPRLLARAKQLSGE